MKEETAETKMRESLLKFAEGVKQLERKHGLSDSMEYLKYSFGSNTMRLLTIVHQSNALSK